MHSNDIYGHDGAAQLVHNLKNTHICVGAKFHTISNDAMRANTIIQVSGFPLLISNKHGH